MTSYFQYNDNKTKKKPALTEHGQETVDIPGIMVTEEGNQIEEERLRAKFGTPHGRDCRCWWCFPDRADDL